MPRATGATGATGATDPTDATSCGAFDACAGGALCGSTRKTGGGLGWRRRRLLERRLRWAGDGGGAAHDAGCGAAHDFGRGGGVVGGGGGGGGNGPQVAGGAARGLQADTARAMDSTDAECIVEAAWATLTVTLMACTDDTYCTDWACAYWACADWACAYCTDWACMYWACMVCPLAHDPDPPCADCTERVE